ncbi:MAG: hypothetical protein HKN91_10320 [Acidimicrobiia bacterium]|nr:hypothetical protein [Acidimicrobiia bacterium]
MHTDRREFLKKAGTAAWVVPAMQIVNMSAAAAGTSGSVTVPGTPEPPTCDLEGWTKATWTGKEWVWSSAWNGSDCFDAGRLTKANGGALGAGIAGERDHLIVAVGDRANIVGAAYKWTGSDSCGVATLSPGKKLAAFEPPHGELTQVELLLELCH